MIYLDVTGSCKSPKSTGIQRATRNIFRELSQRESILPMSWNLLGNCYQRLGRRELQILQDPFRVLPRSTARPDLRGENPIAELQRLLFRESIPFKTKMESGDVLLVPDIYRDGRLSYLPELIRNTGVRAVTIFYDAATLRLGIARNRTRDRFQKYIDSLAAFHLVICISRDSQEHLHQLWQERGTKPTETCVEELPLDDLDPTQREGPIEEASAPGPIILSVGTFEPRKNHLTLLRAAEILWKNGLSFELQLIGRSTGYYGHKVISPIKQLQRAGYPIRWLRHVDDRALHRAYRSCRFTVYPSRMEGFGLPIAESLRHGKPCVCGGNGALGELARPGGCLIVDQTNPDALADAMRTLLIDNTTYERLSADARARNFRSWTDYINRLQERLKGSA
jgi:glycosyltransferase involved in cell wall biosynthesis